MDVDFQKSSKEDQMEVMMMNMMMQMDCNLPAEFNANFSDDIPELSSTILHHHNFSLDPFLNNHNLTSPTSFNPSFLETSSIQEPSSNTPPFPLNSRTGNRVIRTINGSELSNSTHTRSGISPSSSNNNKHNSVTSMRDMIFRIAAMQPIHIDPDSVKPPKRRNVKISKDPQSVAARHRRERISERIRILQRLVPGGTKMDTASMLDEAIHYVKFLKNQVQSLERAAVNRPVGLGFSTMRSEISNSDYSSTSSLGKCYQQPVQMFSSTEMNA